VETVIPGHSNAILTWNDFKDFVEFYTDFLSTVQKELARGKSVDEVAKAYRVPDRFRAKGFSSDPQTLHEQRVKALVESIRNEMKK
jgi:hypothetical protein